MNTRKIFLLLGLFAIILAGGIGIWYILFGPDIEVNPKFPRDAQGEFIQPLEIRTEGETIFAHWIIPTDCEINEVEFQQEDSESTSDWMGGTADCSEEQAGFTCQVNLSSRELSKKTNYSLQAHSYLCTDSNQYVSTVITFSL